MGMKNAPEKRYLNGNQLKDIENKTSINFIDQGHLQDSGNGTWKFNIISI